MSCVSLLEVARYRRERTTKLSESVAQAKTERHFLASSFRVPLTCGLGEAALPLSPRWRAPAGGARQREAKELPKRDVPTFLGFKLSRSFDMRPRRGRATLRPPTVLCPLLTSHCSLLTAHCSLLTAHCSLLTSHFSLLTSHFSLLTSHFSLLTAHCSLLTSHFSLLTSHCSLLTAHFSLLTSHCSLLTSQLLPSCASPITSASP